jgi:hypothetical protein
MCVWDGTFIAPEDEREAMEQIPGWQEDDAYPGDHRDRRAGESRHRARAERRKAA